MDKNEISIAAVSIMSGAAAAMGPAGVPAFILSATLGVMLANFGVKEDEREPVTEDQVKDLLRAHFAEHVATSAWAKIQSPFHYYQDYVNRAKAGENLSERDLQQIDQAINDAIGPNSNLQEGLALLYNEEKPNEFKYVEHNLPIYMLGASIHVQYRLLDIARQKFNGESIVSYQWESVARLIDKYIQSVDFISQYVKNMTIESILRQELAEGKLTIGSTELQDRSRSLHQHYLGSDMDVIKYIHDMQVVKSRLSETANSNMAANA